MIRTKINVREIGEIREMLVSQGCFVGEPNKLANNLPMQVKIETNKIPEDSSDFALINSALTRLVINFKPDLMVSVPSNADRHMLPIFRLLEGSVPYVVLDQPGSIEGLPYPRSRKARKLLEQSERIVLVDEVVTTGHSAIQTARAIGSSRVVGLVSVVDCGQDSSRTVPDLNTAEQIQHLRPYMAPPHIETSFPSEALLTIPLPNIITAHHYRALTAS